MLNNAITYLMTSSSSPCRVFYGKLEYIAIARHSVKEFSSVICDDEIDIIRHTKRNITVALLLSNASLLVWVWW